MSRHLGEGRDRGSRGAGLGERAHVGLRRSSGSEVAGAAGSVRPVADTRRASDYGLPSAQLRLLDALAEREIAAIWRRVDTAATPLCLVVLYAYGLGTAPEELRGWTERSRDAELRRARPADARSSLWQSQQWDLSDALDDLGGVIPEETVALEDALMAAGCEDTEEAFLLEWAYRMSREAAPPVAVSADFACFVAAVEDAVRTQERFVACARPEVVARYRERGWLGAVPGEEALPVRAGTYELEPGPAARLDELLEREARDVRASVSDSVGDEPLCLIAFIWADLQSAGATYVCALTEKQRDAILAGPGGFVELWNPPSWPHSDIFEPSGQPGTEALAEAVAADLEAVDCPEPEEAFLHELAHRLSRAPGELRVTPDFSCYAVDHDDGDGAPAAFRAAATAAALEVFEHRGWLTLPDLDWP